MNKNRIAQQKKSEAPSDKENIIQFLEWAALAWLVIALYLFVLQNPLHGEIFNGLFSGQSVLPSFSAALNYLLNIGIWLGILAGIYSAGFSAVQLLKLKTVDGLEKGIFAIGLGLGLVSIFLLILAAMHELYRPLFIGLWCFGVGGFVWIMKVPEHRKCAGEFLLGLRALFLSKENHFLFRLFLAIFLLLSFVMAFVPELFYDSLVYHMGIPNLYLAEHGLVKIPGATSKFPLLWQVLYTFGLALSDEMVPKLLHWSSALLLMLSFLSLSRRLALGTVGVLAGIIFLSVPMVQMNLWTTGIDVGSCLFSFLTIYTLLVWVNLEDTPENKSEKRSWLILAALFAGFCFGSKYQGGIIAVVAFLMVFIFQIMSAPKNIGALIINLGCFGFVLLAAISPWLIKNFWDTGNPLFPFLTPVFDKLKLQTYHLAPEQLETFMNENRRFLTHNFWDFWKLPWLFTFKDSNQSSLSYPGPLFFTALPLSFFALKNFKKLWVRLLALFLLVYFTFAFSSTHLTRYHMQGYPVLAFFFAVGIGELWNKKNRVYGFLIAAAMVVLMLENLQVGLFIIQNTYQPWKVLMGDESREEYRMYSHSGLNPYPSNQMYRWMEKNLPASSRTLLIGESKDFDLKLPYLYTDVHGQNPMIQWVRESKDADEIYQKFQTAKISHLFVNFIEANRTYGYKMIKWENQDLQKFDQFFTKYVREVHQELIPERFQIKAYLLLYEIMPEEAAKLKPVPASDPLVILEEMSKRK